jgi:hypothetical protein
MKKPGRSRAWRFAAVTVSVVALVLTSVQAAEANTSGSITQWDNSSDPELIQCPNAAGTGLTLCLFTSQDMGIFDIPYGTEKNYYPMNKTMLWRLKDNTSAADPANWQPMGPQIGEQSLVNRGLVPNGANHLWAPGARYIDGKYYVYVPDVTNRSLESTSSRVFAYTSTNSLGTGPYTYMGVLDTHPRFVNVPNSGYASDPQVALPFGGDRYLFYANGDNSNCGGISFAKLDKESMNRFTTAPKEAVINHFDQSGLSQNDNCTQGHPYIEGPAMYRWDEVGAPYELPFNYVLEFAAKPRDGVVPPDCTSDTEVIAYATSWSAEGPWDYQGIIMCGSDTEWTNQASITPHTANNGKILMAWHDGGDNRHNRRSHLSCIVWGSDGKIVRIPRLADNLANCP